MRVDWVDFRPVYYFGEVGCEDLFDPLAEDSFFQVEMIAAREAVDIEPDFEEIVYKMRFEGWGVKVLGVDFEEENFFVFEFDGRAEKHAVDELVFGVGVGK